MTRAVAGDPDQGRFLRSLLEPGGRRFCVFRLYLLGGICRYIFTATGSVSLKLRVDSAGRTISFSPV